MTGITAELFSLPLDCQPVQKAELQHIASDRFGRSLLIVQCRPYRQFYRHRVFAVYLTHESHENADVVCEFSLAKLKLRSACEASRTVC